MEPVQKLRDRTSRDDQAEQWLSALMVDGGGTSGSMDTLADIAITIAINHRI